MASRLWRPTGYVAGDPVKLLLLTHAAGGTKDSPFGSIADTALAAALAAGYTLLSDDAHDRAWGNPTSQADYVAAYNALAATDSIIGTVLWAASMGGLPAASLAANASIPNIRGVLAKYPVLSLASMYSDNPAYQGEINTAYSASSGQGAIVAAGLNCDPYLRTASLFAGIPFHISHSAADTVVNKAHNMDAFATKLSGVTTVTTQVTTGEHGDATNWVWADFSAWLAARFPGLTLTRNSVWSQSGTTITAAGAPRLARTSTTASVTSSTGGPVLLRGTDASRFSLSLDGTTWASTVNVSSGTTTIYIGVTPQAGDSTLTAQVGAPA